MPLISTT